MVVGLWWTKNNWSKRQGSQFSLVNFSSSTEKSESGSKPVFSSIASFLKATLKTDKENFFYNKICFASPLASWVSP